MWVRRSLGHDQDRFSWSYRSSEFVGVAAIDIGDIDTHAFARPVEKAKRAGITISLGHDVVTSGTQSKNSCGDGAHPRAEGQCCFGAFKFGNGLFK